MTFYNPVLMTHDNRSEFYQSFKINKDDDELEPIEIKNPSNVDITDINIACVGDGFIIKNSSCKSTLNKNESCKITIDYEAQNGVPYGKYLGKVEIHYSSRTLTLKLTAEVIPNLTYDIHGSKDLIIPNLYSFFFRLTYRDVR